jgi:hypothetical protein
MTAPGAYYLRIPRAVRRREFTVPDAAHGTNEGYYKYACLCDRCRAYGRDYRRSLDRRMGRR